MQERPVLKIWYKMKIVDEDVGLNSFYPKQPDRQLLMSSKTTLNVWDQQWVEGMHDNRRKPVRIEHNQILGNLLLHRNQY
jgi:hypothetical protein